MWGFAILFQYKCFSIFVLWHIFLSSYFIYNTHFCTKLYRLLVNIWSLSTIFKSNVYQKVVKLMLTAYRGCLAFLFKSNKVTPQTTAVIVVVSGFQSDVSQTLYSSTGLGRVALVYLPTTPPYSSLPSLTT